MNYRIALLIGVRKKPSTIIVLQSGAGLDCIQEEYIHFMDNLKIIHDLIKNEFQEERFRK